MGPVLGYLGLVLAISVCRGTGSPACVELDPISACNCTETTIRCHWDSAKHPGQKNPLDQNLFDSLADFIQKTTTDFIITGGNFSDLNANMFGVCASSPDKSRRNMKSVILKNNNIQKIHGRAFHCVPNLKYLDLSKNNWTVSKNHTRIFSGLPNLEKIYLTDSMKDQYSGQRHLRRLSAVFGNSNLTALQEIHLGKNDLWTFTSDASLTLCQTTKNLRILDLHSNNLAKVVFDPCFGKMTKMERLNLRDNSFVRMTVRTTRMFDQLYQNNNAFTVDLSGHQWDCDCHLVAFTKWIQETRVNIVGKQNMTCHNGGANFGKYLWEIPEGDLVCVATAQPTNAGVIVISILVVIICCVIIVIGFLKREAIKSAFKGLKKTYFAKDISSQFSYASVNNSNLDV